MGEGSPGSPGTVAGAAWRPNSLHVFEGLPFLMSWSEAHQPFTQFLAKFKTDPTFITLFPHPSIQLSPQTANDSHV